MNGSATFGWIITPGRGRPEPLDIAWIKAPAGIAHLQTAEGRNIWIVMDTCLLPIELPGGGQLDERFLMETGD
jgi:hypothetical protein